MHRSSASIPAALVLAAALAGCGGGAPPGEPPLVRSRIVGIADSGGNRLTGSIAAGQQADLAFQVPGKVAAKLVDAGESVRAGQVILRLDPDDLALSAESAAGRQRAAEAQVAAARAEARRAAADERRLNGLVEAGAISAQNYDQARAARESAEAALRAAEAEAAAARSGAGVARNQSAYATLSAGEDGVVTEVLVEPGQVIAAGTVVARLARAGPRDAVVAVPETLVADLPRTATATIFGNGERRYPATLSEVAGAADPATRTFRARYRLQGADRARVGSTVTVTLGNGPPQIAVPLAALHDPGSGAGVWVINRDLTVAFRKVVIGGYGDETALIATGLRPGERVVTLGAHLLKPGQKVRIEPRDGRQSLPRP